MNKILQNLRIIEASTKTILSDPVIFIRNRIHVRTDVFVVLKQTTRPFLVQRFVYRLTCRKEKEEKETRRC